MQVTIAKAILAAVTTEKEQQMAGIPVFYAKDEEEQVRIATILSRVMEAVAHDLENGILIIVKH